jgi:general secretion pathway protein G
MNESVPNKTKTSPAALWSLIFGIVGPAIFSQPIAAIIRGIDGFALISESIHQLSLLCSIISIILGIAGLTRIHTSARRVKGSGYAIIGLVLGSIWSIALITGFRGRISYTKEQVAKYQIIEFEQALQGYAMDNGSLPTTEQGLEALTSDKGKGPYLRKGLPIDPWSRPYQYHNPGMQNPDSYDIWSNGKDGIEGTADDVTSKSNPHCIYD